MVEAPQMSTAGHTQVEDFALRPQWGSTRGASNPAGVSNAIEWFGKASQNQVPLHEAPPRVFTKPSTSTSSAESFTKHDTASIDSVGDASSKDVSIFLEHWPRSSPGLSISNANRAHVVRSSGLRERNKSAQPRPAVSRARASADRVPFRAVLRSNTLDVVRSIVELFTLPNRAPSRRDSGLGDKTIHEVRRNRAWIHVHFDCLEDRLKAATNSSQFSMQKFLPNGLLDELVTQTSVEGELSRWKHIPLKFVHTWKRPHSIRIEPEKDRGANFPLRSRSTSELLRQGSDRTYRKIFAILTFIARPASIWLFVEEGICDADLPLLQVSGADGAQRCFELRGRQASKTLRCFQGWENGMIHRFLERQWLFLVPCFETSDGNTIPHQNFHPDEIMPFTCWKETPERGGFGQVYEAHIHSDHHTFDKTQVPGGVVAVKKLLSNHPSPFQNKEAFLKESEILRNMSRERHTHNHLINLLATFSHSGQYYLVFPWADADLEHYWQYIKPDPPTSDPSMEFWLVEQCQGIVEGLTRVHRYTTLSNSTMLSQIQHPRKGSRGVSSCPGPLNLIGRHGDIKPKNILWFPDRISKSGYGVLKITDFGIAQFTSENKAQKREKGLIPNSLTYRSPECDLLDEEVSVQCDVWALGCVYLVFITWFFGGWRAVERFSDRRNIADEFWHGFPTDSFFSVVRDESGVAKAKVKDAVTQVIDELRSHYACTETLRTLLDLIRYEMLIVQKKIEAREGNPAPGGLLVPGKAAARRKSSGHIAVELGSIMTNCKAASNRAARAITPPGD